MDIRTAALGIGLAALEIVSAWVVYLRTQTFGAAGVSLVGGGVLLMMLSMWSATTLEVAEQGAAPIGEVQRDVVQLDEAAELERLRGGGELASRRALERRQPRAPSATRVSE